MEAKQFFTWCESNIKNIDFFFISAEEIKTSAERFCLTERYQAASTVPGRRSNHYFSPLSANLLLMKRVSLDSISTNVKIGASTRDSYTVYTVGKYIACVYDKKWYIGMIKERSDQNGDVLVIFMKRNGLSLNWFEDQSTNQCWVPFNQIICVVDVPNLEGRRGNQYT